jgi:apolipoprotein N-acyltransferase
MASLLPALLAAFVLGLFVASGFAPFGLWPLALTGFAGLLLLLSRTDRGWRAAALGWCFGVGQFVLGLDWIATAFTFQAKMPAWLGGVAVVALSLYLAVYPALAALAAWWATRRLRGGAATLSLLFGATWAIGEWLRGTMFTGFPWNPASVAYIDLPIAQLAKLTGTYALSGLIVASAGFILILATRPRESLGRRTLLSAVNIPAAIGLVLLLGCYVAPVISGLVSAPAPAAPATGPLVHIVQPDIGQDERWDPQLTLHHLLRLQALSGKPGARPRLLLWPESGIEENIAEDPDAAARLTAPLGPHDILLGGGELPIRDRSGNLIAARNSVFAVAADGGILAHYDKAHLVPYGEYLPMRPLLSAIGLSRLVPGDLDFWPGPGPRTLTLPGFGPVGVQICYEIVFSGHVVDEAHRPAFLFNPSNDAWFGRSGPPQHLAQARLRAIEEGLPVARATTTGISAIVDRDGRIVQSLGPQAVGLMAQPMPAAAAPTLFSRIGNLAVALIAVLLGALAIAARRYKESFI